MSDEAYALGHSQLAAERLKLVARLFEPEMRRFIRDAAPPHPRVAVDLGCGPGCTTRLLRQASGAAVAVGVDLSEQFLGVAADSAPALRFVRHDLTEGPPPVEPADLLFCHLLLSHLAAPLLAIESWKACLTPAGVILVDEVESIQTDDPVFVEYLALVEEAIGGRGGELYVGRKLAEAGAPRGLRLRSSRVEPQSVAAKDAATMFGMTFQTLREDPAVQAAAGPAGLAALGRALEARTALEGQPPLEWRMRQIVYEPRPSA
ncbi:MAG: class I SAM-dependent methyltransferase [Gemmatimonadaceae bacterium]|nr:class I SAM-dependent methyltransferase [Gemmatimonadaceae bacterium]